MPVVLTRGEVASILALMEGTPQLVTKVLNGSGLRIMEAVRFRVQDIDYEYNQPTVRSGKGAKDRLTTFPTSLIPLLKSHLAKVWLIHQQNLAQGCGEVYLPHALAQKYPAAVRKWGWQYVFPSGNLATDPRRGVVRRHHIDPSVINKAIKSAVRKTGLTKRVSVHMMRHYAEVGIIVTCLPPTCLNAAWTYERFRSNLAIRMSAQRKYTRM